MINYRRNIPKHYLFTFFSNINFTSGLWMIFLSQRGFSLIELGLLESIFHISSLIFEIPSGALADLIGRKYCRLGGRVALFISLAVMYYADSFLMQAAGFAICAFGYNLESGAGEAFAYDSLKFLGEEGRYKRVAGFVELFFQAGGIIAFALGGLLASSLGYFYVFLFSGCSVIISFMTGLTFHEVNSTDTGSDEKADEPRRDLKAFAKILTDSLKLIKLRPRIMFLILFSETVFAFTTSLFFYLQNYFKTAAGYQESFIGIIYAAASIISAMSSVAASWIEKKTGEKKLLILLPVLLSISLWGVGLTDYKALFFILTGFIEGVLIVVISDYLNKMIPSEIRATVLSFQSMSFSLIMIVLFPLIGAAADMMSFRTAFLLMAAIATVLTAAYIIFTSLWTKYRSQP